jgi:hypothetical protein
MSELPSRSAVLCGTAVTALIVLISATTSSAQTGGWSFSRSDSPGIANRLFGVTRISPTDAWAVGDTIAGNGDPLQPLVEHWNGVRWRAVDALALGGGAHEDLGAVAASAPDDVWAVGEWWTTAHPAHTRGLIGHYDGATWAIVPSPNPTHEVYLTGVSAYSRADAWAVGSVFADHQVHQLPLAMHWDGVSWQVVPTPAPNSYSALNAVVEISSSDVWAVGMYTIHHGGTNRSLIEHWNGVRWKVIAAPKLGREDQLNGVSASSPTDAWAVGYTKSRSREGIPIALHWDGASWTSVPMADPGRASWINGVSAVSSSSALAVGIVQRPGFVFRTLIERWDGTAWTTVASPDHPSDAETLFAVSANADGAFAVGNWNDLNSGKTKSLIEECCS